MQERIQINYQEFLNPLYLINDHFLVAYGDDLTNINLNQIFKKYYKNNKKKALVTVYKKISVWSRCC